MRGFYEVEKKAPRREETAADWRAAEKNDPRVSDAEAAKLAKKLGSKLVGKTVKEATKKATVRKLVDELNEGIEKLSKRRSRK